MTAFLLAPLEVWATVIILHIEITKFRSAPRRLAHLQVRKVLEIVRDLSMLVALAAALAAACFGTFGFECYYLMPRSHHSLIELFQLIALSGGVANVVFSARGLLKHYVPGGWSELLSKSQRMVIESEEKETRLASFA